MVVDRGKIQAVSTCDDCVNGMREAIEGKATYGDDASYRHECFESAVRCHGHHQSQCLSIGGRLSVAKDLAKEKSKLQVTSVEGQKELKWIVMSCFSWVLSATFNVLLEDGRKYL
jgi:ribosomal silencing factor RsfS